MAAWFQRILVAAMVFIGSLGVVIDYLKRPQETWLAPVQYQRSGLFLAAGVALGIVALVALGRTGRRLVTAPGLLIVLIAFYSAFTRAIHEDPMEGAKSAVFAAATLLPLLIAVPAYLRGTADMYGLLRFIMGANIVWIACVMVQFVLRWKLLVAGNEDRFAGLTGNPQHAGTFLAALGVIALWLLINDPKTRYRLLWAGVLGANIILLIWTGSRTAFGMLVLGSTLTLYARMGRAVFILPVAALFAYAAFKIATGANIDLGAERLVSTENTRAQVWTRLFQEGMSSPLVGSGLEEAGVTENSYLLGFASSGIGMVVLMLLLAGASAVGLLRIFRARWRLDPPHRAFADLAMAYICMYFAGAMFEGYMLSRVGPHPVFFIVFSALGLRVVQLSYQEQADREAGWYADEALDEGTEGAPAAAS